MKERLLVYHLIELSKGYCFTKLFSVNHNKIICRNIKNKHIPFFLKKKNNWGVKNFYP